MFEYQSQRTQQSIAKVVPGFAFNTLQSYASDSKSCAVACRSISQKLRAFAKRTDDMVQRGRALKLARQYRSQYFQIA